jgi:hypothetical protein
MKITNILLSCAAFAALSATASAALMTYTQTGFLSGSLDGTSFTDAAVTLRVTADTANVNYAELYGGLMPVWTNAGVTTIDIVGFETATFNGSNTFGVFSQNLSALLPGTAAVGIGDLTNLTAILGNYQTTELNYALDTATTFTGAAFYNGTYSTTLGDLITTGTSGDATFTAAVPEPSAFALLGLGTVGLVARRRRVA